MIRERIVLALRGVIPHILWPAFWWLMPLSAILILPLGSLFLQGLLYAGIDTARTLQLLWLCSLIYGPAVGISVLLLAGKAGLSLPLTARVRWLARFAVISPLMTLLILFNIFSKLV